MRARHSLPSVIILPTLFGCAFTPTVRDAHNESKKITRHASHLLESARDPTLAVSPPHPFPPNTFWLGARPIPDSKKRGSTLTSRNVVMKESYASLSDVIEALSRDAGIPTRLTRDTIPNANLPITLSVDGGELIEALDAIANRYNLFWSEENGSINFALTETRVFFITAVGDDVKNSVSVSSDQGSSASSGGNTATTAEQKATFTATNLSSFKAIEDTCRSMLSPIGKLVASPAAGTIVITDAPEKLDRIGQYIVSQNNHFQRQIAIDFRVYTVSQKNTDSLGFDWNALFTALTNKYGLRLASPSGLSANTGSFALTIPSTASGGAGQYGGSELIARALSEYATVTQVTSATLRTLNNKPTQYRRGDTLAYIASTSSTATANVGITNATQTARERLGFALNVLPHALQDGSVVMQTSISLKTLKRLRTIQQGQGTSQTVTEAPETDENELGAQSIVRSGETLVLAGFEQGSTSSNQSGVGFASNLLFGGESGVKSKDIVVFTLTPVVIDRP